MRFIYTNGSCYEFFKILRNLYPEAELWYDYVEGHVYTKIDKFWYDIRGIHYKVSDNCVPHNNRDGHRPYRWVANSRAEAYVMPPIVTLELTKSYLKYSEGDKVYGLLYPFTVDEKLSKSLPKGDFFHVCTDSPEGDYPAILIPNSVLKVIKRPD
jgi:hypothetical protein